MQLICDPVLEERQVFSCRISVFENYAFQVRNNTLLSVRQWSDLHSIPTSSLGKRFSLLLFGCCFALVVNSRGHAGKVNLFRGWLNQTSQYISWTWVRHEFAPSLVVSRRRASCELLSNEWATNTGKLPHEGLSRYREVKQPIDPMWFKLLMANIKKNKSNKIWPGRGFESHQGRSVVSFSRHLIFLARY